MHQQGTLMLDIIFFQVDSYRRMFDSRVTMLGPVVTYMEDILTSYLRDKLLCETRAHSLTSLHRDLLLPFKYVFISLKY